MSTAGVIAIIIFLSGMIATFLKYISNLDGSMKVLTTSFNERTNAIVSHLGRIDKALGVLANADIRIAHLEQEVAEHDAKIATLPCWEADLRMKNLDGIVKDHETRLRAVEGKVATRRSSDDPINNKF